MALLTRKVIFSRRRIFLIVLFLSYSFSNYPSWGLAPPESLSDTGPNKILIEKIQLLSGFQNNDLSLGGDSKIKWTTYLNDWRNKFQNGISNICRRPALYELLRQFGEISGSPVSDICPELKFMTQTGDLIKFNFSQILELSYVIAGQGEAIESRFGHSMVGIKICTLPAADCSALTLKYKSSHFSDYLAGFAANTLNGSTFLSGLIGRFSTSLHFDFRSTVESKYLYQDFRTIVSNPLLLTNDQKRLFIYALEEHFWFYKSNYYFLNNNCASEMLKLFKLISAFNSQILVKASILTTPDSLTSELFRDKLANKINQRDESNRLPNISIFSNNLYGETISIKNLAEIDPLDRKRMLLSSFKRKELKLTSEMFRNQCQILERAILQKLSATKKNLIWSWYRKNRETIYWKSPLCLVRLAPEIDRWTNDLQFRSYRKVEGNFVPENSELQSDEEKRLKMANLINLLKALDECSNKNLDVVSLNRKIQKSESNLEFCQKKSPEGVAIGLFQ